MAQDLGAGQTTRVVDSALFGIGQEQTLNILWTSIFTEPEENILQCFFLFANPNANKGNAYELYSYIGNFSAF